MNAVTRPPWILGHTGSAISFSDVCRLRQVQRIAESLIRVLVFGGPCVPAPGDACARVEQLQFGGVCCVSQCSFADRNLRSCSYRFVRLVILA